ncbi:hypothetical protein ACFLX7_02200 [Chloroflexota bacterium]
MPRLWDSFYPPHQCIDTNNYNGEVVCPKCNSLLHVKPVRGKLQKRKVVDKGKITFTAEDCAMAARELREAMEKEGKLLGEDAPKPPVSTDDKPPLR